MTTDVVNEKSRVVKYRGLAGVADQVFSSLSNGLILYAVAVVSTAQYFGLISIQLTLLAAALGCLRGAFGTSLLLKAGDGRDEIRREGSYALTATLLFSPILAASMWLVDTGDSGTTTLMVAIATPIVLVQDILRYVVIAEGRPHVAALWDGVWFVGSFGLLVCTWMDWHFVNVEFLIGGWALLAFVALIGMGISGQIVPGIKGFGTWLRTDWVHRVRYGVDSGLDQLAIFVMLALVAIIVNPTVTAALRGATALLAPVSMLTSSLPLIVVPETARTSATPSDVWRKLARVSVITSVASTVAGVIWAVLPDSIGTLLLGNTFGITQEIILWIALEYTIAWWALAIMVWLKAFNRSADLLGLKIAYVITLTAFPVLAAWYFREATEIAIALVLASTLVATVAQAYFAPWRDDGSSADRDGGHRVGRGGTDRQPPVWQHKVMRRSHFAARGIPDFVHPGSQPGARHGVSSLLLAFWVFAIMGIIGPLLIIMLTGPAPTLTWVGPLAIAIIAAARYAWIIGLGERRLLEIMFWSFTYPFMGLAPMTELREWIWPIITPRSDFSLAWPAVMIVLTGTLAFLLGVFANRSMQVRNQRHGTARRFGPVTPTGDYTVRNYRILILAAFAIAFNLYYSYKVGWIQFTQSRLALEEIVQRIWPSSAVAIFIRAGTYMTLLTAWVALVRFRREAIVAGRSGRPQSVGTMRLNLVLILVISVLLANSMNPISNARYLSGTALLAAAAGLGLFATAARFRISALSFLAALLVIFPIMDVFRYRNAQDLSDANPLRAFLSPDYDSFANIINGYLIAEREGIHVGRQLMGVVLFWIPRALWQDKPVDTGILLAQNRGYFVVNLSAPLWIEMYMNGGYVLLILGMFALGYFLHAWDTRLDMQLSVFKMPSILGSIVPFYMFILLRGSLLQAMPYLMVTVVCWLFVRAKHKRNRRRAVAYPGPATAAARKARRPVPPERQPANV